LGNEILQFRWYLINCGTYSFTLFHLNSWRWTM